MNENNRLIEQFGQLASSSVGGASSSSTDTLDSAHQIVAELEGNGQRSVAANY